ncbi:DUF2807 domain-containing protein [Chitinimonas prasina]|uniref:DUF2807 domain-containing protein n=1 Tax=Chitinimonas prasina TaxID=1434937 RepID=A0ABQ5YJ43_9NEIS|nr:head GIN domain-containing protein [Chitinimonas prasina]GLR13692.1 DUF2807 domain-containing protein [Chitinimonas prasina]
MRYGLLLALCLPLAACSINVDNDEKTGDIRKVHVSIGGMGGVKGNGVVTKESRTLTAVKTVKSTGSMDVDVRIGDTPSMVVEGDENLVKLVVTEQVGDKLIIKTEGAFSTEQGLKVSIVTPALASLENTGSGDVTVRGLAGGDLLVESTGSGETSLSGKLGKLTVRMVGSGDLVGDGLLPTDVKIDVLGSGEAKLGRIEVDRFEAAIKGSGGVEASGLAKMLEGNVMGSGELDLQGLQSQEAKLDLMGSGDMRVHAVASVIANAMGSGDITIWGKPAKQQLSGENARLAAE